MGHKERLKELQTQLLDEFTDNILPYWFNHTLDLDKGGFVGQVDYKNLKITESNKHGILNARILWSFSHSYKNLKDEDSRYLALRAYDYFTSTFLDEKYGGTFWEVDAMGEVADFRKYVYLQAFSIYALVEFHSAFNEPEALNKAVEIYSLIESRCKDEKYGGYFEAFNREWEVIDDVRLSDKDENEPKSMNTHLHVLEAYTTLYRYHPAEELRKDLEDIISLFLNNIIARDSKTLHCFFSEEWLPKSKIISFGHDIEASWLLAEAVEAINSETILSKIKPVLSSIADHVLSCGVDADGGLINEITLSGKNDYNKDWWPQAEAMVGFMNAFQITKDPKFLDAVFKSWEFIRHFVVDNQYGEWFEKVNRIGIPYKNMDKVRAWKAPYHNSRAIFEVCNRIDQVLGDWNEMDNTSEISESIKKLTKP